MSARMNHEIWTDEDGDAVEVGPLGAGAWVKIGDDRVFLSAVQVLELSDYLRSLAQKAGSIDNHEFFGVRGHPDDDECTFRGDGTDQTYCGQPRSAHKEAGL